MSSKLACFTKQVVTLAHKAVVGNPQPAVQRGERGYADWVIVSIHGLKTYLYLPYRRLLDVLYEMPRIARIIGLKPSELPDFTTVCSRMQGLKMPLWRDVLRLSAELHEPAKSRRSTQPVWIGLRRASITPNARITRSEP